MRAATLQQWVSSAALTLCLMSAASFAQSPASKDASGAAKPAAAAKAEAEDPKRAKLIADTRRMLALSREVQAAMAKGTTETLSLDAVKKVEELQKLAAVVKAEMGKVR